MTRTQPLMGTFVTIRTAGEHDDPAAAVARAFEWFEEVEARCTRFDPRSEIMQVVSRPGEAVAVSEILFQAVEFALAVAAASGGAFDPTVGARLERHGFDREHRTGARVRSEVARADATYRDVHLDAKRRTITISRPLVIDLGAVAKGLAIDLAARELAPLRNFAIDAGGDLYLGGHAAGGRAWSVGIRHPVDTGELLETLSVTDAAVCTSGGYERRSPLDSTIHHILDPRRGACADAAISATVVAPSAMVADALATAAFVLGPVEGVQFLEAQGAGGVIVTTGLERHATSGFDLAAGRAALLPDAEGAAHHHSRGARGSRRAG